jgi:signal peptidase II
MFYFPMVNTVWPQWVPFLGGKGLRFFEPIFNLADAAISTGVITLLVFQKKFLGQQQKPVTPQSSGNSGVTENTLEEKPQNI